MSRQASKITGGGQLRSKASEQIEGTVIVGGGIAGLATAAALRSIAGVNDVRILERLDRAAFHDDRSGAGAQLGPNGLRALHAIGGDALVNSIVSTGSKLVGNAILMPDAPQPMVIPDTAEADSGLPQVLLRWGSLRSVLTDLIPADQIEYGKGDTVTGYDVSEDGEVSLLTNCGNEIGPSSAPLIIGADGIHSTFRQCVINDITEQADFDKRQEGLKYNKRVNVKAIVQSVLNEETFKPNHTYSFFTPGGGTACFAGPAGEGYTYWATSIADEDGEKDDIISLAFSPEMDKEAMKAALLSRLRNLEQPLCEFVVQMIEATEPRYIYVQISQEAETIGPRLASKDGKVVCVGDAAHPMSSSYGQAVNFALEDAATLAVCVRDSDDLASALKSYEVSRLDRCNEMVRRSAERAAKSMKGEQVEGDFWRQRCGHEALRCDRHRSGYW